ncbi:MmcB family DNA repair protein [Rhizobium sp. Rhizsp82]|uniref:MmcB family DNA repair protein n=1 Tax=Rhizobium sp. Rhizsp82 TaxID=3243057 RepID=UPI0039B419C4
MDHSIKHDDLMNKLAAHLRANGDRMVWEDMQLGPSGSPRPDVYTLMKSYMHPLPTAYECKISIADFRSDVTSGKWQKYFEFAGAVFFCTPKGLVQKSDIPNGCGLIWFYPDSGTFKTIKGPTLGRVTLPQAALLKLLIDGLKRLQVPERRSWEQEHRMMQQLRRRIGDEVSRLPPEQAER